MSTAWAPVRIPDIGDTAPAAAPVLPSIVCAITSPSAGASLPQGSPVTISGTISVNAASVAVSLLSGAVLGAATIDNTAHTWSYSYTPLAADFGSQVMSAFATASAGGSTSTATLSVNVTEPSVMALVNGMVGRWSVDDASSQVDAGAITAITDTSGAGGNYGGGTGLTFRSARWNTDLAALAHTHAIHTASNYLVASSTALLAAFNGVNHPHTVIDVFTDLSEGSHQLWSAQNTYPNVLTRVKSLQKVKYEFKSTTDVVLGTVQTNGAQIAYLERSATQLNHYSNGILDSACPIACTDAFSYTATELTWGKQDGSAAISNLLHRERVVFNRALTASERQDVTARLAYKHGLDWCQAIGQGRGTTGKDVVIIPVCGQSNAVGRGTLRYTRICDDVWVYDWDGFVRTVPKGDPIATSPLTNSIPSGISRTALGGYDSWSALADTLKADPQFANKILLFVPSAVDSATSDFLTGGTGTTPRDITTGYGNTWHKVTYALRAKNAKIGPVVIRQGETNTDTLTHATTKWTSDWAAFCTAFDADFSGKFLKTLHYIFITMPPTVPVSFNATNWAALRSSQRSIASTITNAMYVDSYDGPFIDSNNLHSETGTISTGLRGDGIQVGTAYLAAA